MKCVKSFYWSTLDSNDPEREARNNPSRTKAYNYAKKIGGKVRIKYHDEDEGREYRVYK